MSIGRGSWLMGGLALIVMVACSGSEADEVGGWPKDEMLCEAGFSRPEGFRQREAFEDPYEDHVGIRLGFVDDAGRELHYFAGIPGEFGEGLLEAGPDEFRTSDLDAVQARWVEPISVEAFAHRVWSPPPASQGYTSGYGLVQSFLSVS